MSTTYILEELEKINSLKERQKEAVRLVRCFKDRIPTGGSNPPIWPGDSDDENIRSNASYTESFYQRIRSLCNGFPAEIKESYQEFQKNRVRTEELLALQNEDRRKLAIHELFPYWNNFNEEVHKILKNNCLDNLDLESITFLPKIIAKGGFAMIYSAEDKEGKKYALKLFYPLDKFPIGLGERHARKANYTQIARNIITQRELFSKEPFACLRAFHYPERYEPMLGYLMDFIPGRAIIRSLENKIELPDETIGRVLMTYAQMLESLHSQQKLFGDNNWGAVITNNENIRVCDYDFVTPIENVAQDEFHAFDARYGSQEHYLERGLNTSSDLEGFSLMIDHLLIKETYLAHGRENREDNRIIVESNKRMYPKTRRAKLTKQLGQVVSALITYPRDNSISAKDFVSAIKKDYRI